MAFNSSSVEHIYMYKTLYMLVSCSGKSATVRESNHGSGVCKAHNA